MDSTSDADTTVEGKEWEGASMFLASRIFCCALCGFRSWAAEAGREGLEGGCVVCLESFATDEGAGGEEEVGGSCGEELEVKL